MIRLDNSVKKSTTKALGKEAFPLAFATIATNEMVGAAFHALA